MFWANDLASASAEARISRNVMAAGSKASHPNLVLAICCASVLLVGMDVTIVNVALPVIEQDLHATLSQLQWVGARTRWSSPACSC